MLKERATAIAVGVFLLDLALVAAAFWLAWVVRDRVLVELGLLPTGLYPFVSYLPLLASLPLWGLMFWISGFYRSHRIASLSLEMWQVARACVASGALLMIGIFLLRLDERLLGADRVSRLWLLLVVVLSIALVGSEKLALRLLARSVRSRGYNYRTLLIVGPLDSAAEAARAIRSHRFWGFRILGILTHDPHVEGERLGEVPVLGRPEEMLAVAEGMPVDEVLVAVSGLELRELEPELRALEEQGVCIRLLLDPLPGLAAHRRLGELAGVPLLTYASTPVESLGLILKRGVDVAASLVLLIVTLPLHLVIALLIKTTSKGPVLYRQTRVGRNGRSFTLLKFRTMVEGAAAQRAALDHLNEAQLPVFKIRRDPRVTPVGRWLRRFSLDELPQLWNVLRGEMSLVGPRPALPEEVRQYQRWQRRRLSMRPGLTCLWQVRGRSQLDDFESWVRLDLAYIDNWSPILDLKILLRTVPAVLFGRGAW